MVSFLDRMEQGFRGFAIDRTQLSMVATRTDPNFPTFHRGTCEQDLALGPDLSR
ncbi:hypothetical protein [Tropicibacter sp. S64]|uniref:hypothetical protein n=1 Tax=Tropicibacter sp. S64 TaxID=3415122 RepID=UPI003C7BA221